MLCLQEQVNEMASRYKECFGEVFRFQILNSTLWVDHISERHNGWYPASSGPGEILGTVQGFSRLRAHSSMAFRKHAACFAAHLGSVGQIPYVAKATAFCSLDTSVPSPLY